MAVREPLDIASAARSTVLSLVAAASLVKR